MEIADISAALSQLSPRPRLTALPALSLAVNLTDPLRSTARPDASPAAPDACRESDACIDQYLWSLYERTSKVDTVKVEERIKVKVKSKGKTRTVVQTLSLIARID